MIVLIGDLDLERYDGKSDAELRNLDRRWRGHRTPGFSIQPGRGHDLQFALVDLLEREVLIVDRAQEPPVVSAVGIRHGQMGHKRPYLGVLLHLGVSVRRQGVDADLRTVIVDVIDANHNGSVRRK